MRTLVEGTLSYERQKEIKVDVGKNIRTLSRKNHMSCTEVAEKAGVDLETIRRAVGNRCKTRRKTLESIARALGVTFEELTQVEFDQDEKSSQNIAILRKKRGMTQEALARNTGLSLKTIQTAEKNIKHARQRTLELIAATLGVSIEDLLFCEM